MSRHIKRSGARAHFRCPLYLVMGSLVCCYVIAQQSSSIRFANRARQSGVTFVLRNGTTEDKPIVDSILGGVALLDYDNDGYLDIYFTNGASLPGFQKNEDRFSNRLYRNNHDGTFTDVTDKAGVRGFGYSIGGAAADFDNDGWTDLYVTGIDRNTLFHNNGNGTFTDVTDHAHVAGTLPNGKKLLSVS